MTKPTSVTSNETHTHWSDDVAHRSRRDTRTHSRTHGRHTLAPIRPWPNPHTKHGCVAKNDTNRARRLRTHTNTNTTAGTWTRATHTTHTCQTGQLTSILHRRDAANAYGASLDGTARVNGYTKNGKYPGKNGKIPGWDEMGVEFDDGKLKFF